MKKSFRVKFLVIFLAMLTLLTACNGGETPSGTGSGSDSLQSSDAQPAELVWYTPVNNIQAGKDDVLNAVNDYVKDKLNLTVDIHLYLSLIHILTALPVIKPARIFPKRPHR